jgi:hypothetical protein
MTKIFCLTANCPEFILDDATYDYSDWLCTECFEKQEMAFFGWRDIDSDHMNTRMADAEMGDL